EIFNSIPHSQNSRQHFSNILVSYLALIDNLLDSAYFAGFKAHLDAMRVMSGTCKYLLHDSTCPLSSTLILLLDDVDLKPRLYVFSVLAIHISSLPRKIAT